jgi:hypothetical protein
LSLLFSIKIFSNAKRNVPPLLALSLPPLSVTNEFGQNRLRAVEQVDERQSFLWLLKEGKLEGRKVGRVTFKKNYNS